MSFRRRAVFLDRDGVLAEPLVRGDRAYAPLSLEQFRVTAGVAEDVARLRRRGLVCIVVTNQPELARGLLDPAVLEEMHGRLRTQTAVDDIYVCPHDPADGCRCHKPKPGLLEAAAAQHAIDLPRSFLVGDRWRDIGAGEAVGCHTILIARPYSACERADARVATLGEAVDVILSRIQG